MTRRLAPGLVLALAVACAAGDTASSVRREIESTIARSVEATRSQDIDAYMALVPDGATIRGDSGETISRDQLRSNILRDWSIIPKTLSLSVSIESVAVHGDSATVVTSQRWERLMLERDGRTTDTVLTTQRHEETWRKTPEGWRAFDVKELGGEVFVNGKPYQE